MELLQSWAALLGVGEWVAVISAAIAVLSFVLNNIVVRRQLALQTEEIRTAVDAEKTRWLGETLAVFAEAEAMALRKSSDNGATAAGGRLQLAQRLSVLADQGRLSFPNLDPNDRGRENPAAYQGHRQPAIDAVILAHDVMRDLPLLKADAKEIQHLLFACRRILVSEVQKSVDPRRRAQALQAQRQRTRKDVAVSYDEVKKIVSALKEMAATKVSYDEPTGRTES